MPEDQYNSTVTWKHVGRVDGCAQFGQSGVDETVVSRLDIPAHISGSATDELPNGIGILNGGLDVLYNQNKFSEVGQGVSQCMVEKC